MKTAMLIVGGVFYGLVALLMIGAILLQESKGGGLAALGGTRAETAFGASNPLRRLTTVLAIFFFLLASALTLGLAPPKSATAAGAKRAAEEKAAEEKRAAEELKAAGDAGKGVEAVTDIKDAPGEKKPDAATEDAPPPAPGEKAGEKPPADKPVDKPADKPAEKPAEKPAG